MLQYSRIVISMLIDLVFLKIIKNQNTPIKVRIYLFVILRLVLLSTVNRNTVKKIRNVVIFENGSNIECAIYMSSFS